MKTSNVIKQNKSTFQFIHLALQGIEKYQIFYRCGLTCSTIIVIIKNVNVASYVSTGISLNEHQR